MPNLFVLGAAKAGTTALCQYLAQHPEIYFPSEKEPGFFSDNLLYSKGWEWYLSKYFADAAGYLVRGEGTPRYLRMPQRLIPRLKKAYSDDELKFVVVLRDPVLRAWSHYLHRVRDGAESKSFAQALQLEDERMAEDPEAWYGYFRDGLYSQQLKEWFEEYPRENFKIIFSENLLEAADEEVSEVFRFLHVNDSIRLSEVKKRNQASTIRFKWLAGMMHSDSIFKTVLRLVLNDDLRRDLAKKIIRKNRKEFDVVPKLDPDDAFRLRGKYMEEINDLERLLQCDLSRWKNEPQ